VGWDPEGHSNYYMNIRTTRGDAPPRFFAFVDPDLRGNTVGWRTERDLKNYKQVIGLPKSLQAWVLSDIEKSRADEWNSKRSDAMRRVAARGVPHDLERAYQRLRQVLVPAVEVEDMHTVTGYDESRSALTEMTGNVFELKKVPLNVQAGRYVAPFVDFVVYRYDSEGFYQLSIGVAYRGIQSIKRPAQLYSIGYIYDDAREELVARHYGSKTRNPIASLTDLDGPRELWIKLLSYRMRGGGHQDPLKPGLMALFQAVQQVLFEKLPPEVERFTREKFFHVTEPEEMHMITGYDESLIDYGP